MLNLNKLFKETWLQAEESTCLKKKVGALLVSFDSGVILGKGCGMPDTPCKVCVRKTYTWTQDGCWSIHGEVRAIFDALEKQNIFTSNSYFSDCFMLTTHGPCDQCIKYMVHFKIPLIIYEEEYKTNYFKWKNKILIYQKNYYMENIL